MSQAPTYRPAVAPSEAVMIPASESAVPAAPEAPAQDAPKPRAERPRASLALERARNLGRTMNTQSMQWVPVANAPIGGAPAPQASARNAQGRAGFGGAALSSLMRSAARRYTPPPAMRQPMAVQAPRAQPPMRGALRSVVRQAQTGAART